VAILSRTRRASGVAGSDISADVSAASGIPRDYPAAALRRIRSSGKLIKIVDHAQGWQGLRGAAE
jgi:hypothetical protein